MKFVVLGKYSSQGLAGFVKNPSDNRQEAAKKITEAAGGKLLEMMTLRGAYDFIAIIEGSDFETMAGMKMLMQSTGTIEDMSIMEAVDFNKAAEKAAKNHDLNNFQIILPVGKFNYSFYFFFTFHLNQVYLEVSNNMFNRQSKVIFILNLDFSLRSCRFIMIALFISNEYALKYYL